MTNPTPMSSERKLTKDAEAVVLEQALDATLFGSGHDALDQAVYDWLRADGDDETADDMLARNLVIHDPDGRAALEGIGDGTR